MVGPEYSFFCLHRNNPVRVHFLKWDEAGGTAAHIDCNSILHILMLLLLWCDSPIKGIVHSRSINLHYVMLSYVENADNSDFTLIYILGIERHLLCVRQSMRRARLLSTESSSPPPEKPGRWHWCPVWLSAYPRWWPGGDLWVPGWDTAAAWLCTPSWLRRYSY